VLFILAQQAVNQTVATRRGLANGYVVSLYPLGAMLGAPLLGWAIQAYGVRAALAGLALALVAVPFSLLLFLVEDRWRPLLRIDRGARDELHASRCSTTASSPR
jgi:MFS family permease